MSKIALSSESLVWIIQANSNNNRLLSGVATILLLLEKEKGTNWSIKTKKSIYKLFSSTSRYLNQGTGVHSFGCSDGISLTEIKLSSL